MQGLERYGLRGSDQVVRGLWWWLLSAPYYIQAGTVGAENMRNLIHIMLLAVSSIHSYL